MRAHLNMLVHAYSGAYSFCHVGAIVAKTQTEEPQTSHYSVFGVAWWEIAPPLPFGIRAPTGRHLLIYGMSVTNKAGLARGLKWMTGTFLGKRKTAPFEIIVLLHGGTDILSPTYLDIEHNLTCLCLKHVKIMTVISVMPW